MIANNFDENERNAMRSFLQRVEVRLSTMHRIGSAFLGGAGLLLLFPVFFKEVITGMMTLFMNPMYESYSLLILSKFLLLIPFILSLFIPLYALYYLLKDIVHFYFVGHTPGFPTTLFNPRFVLSGLAFSSDESKEVKRQVLINQYSSNLIHFVLPFGEEQAKYYDEIISSNSQQIIPEDRKIEKLFEMNVISRLETAPEVAVHCEGIYEKRSPIDIERFNAAFGLAGVKDRLLIEEVAKGEASLVKHATGLRRLVLRYMKALLMFILTTLVSFFLISWIRPNAWTIFIIALGYLLWAILTPIVLKLPINWIYNNADPRSESVVSKDTQLVDFEKKVSKLANISIIVSSISILLFLINLYISIDHV
jgi:hypothetical protein